MIPPRDFPQGVTAWGVTNAEQMRGEPVAERATHERPDPDRAGDPPLGRLEDRPDEDPIESSETGDRMALSAEEEAVHRARRPR